MSSLDNISRHEIQRERISLEEDLQRIESASVADALPVNFNADEDSNNQQINKDLNLFKRVLSKLFFCEP